MESEWAETRVDDVFDLVTGFAFKSKEFVESGIPVIKIKNVKAGYFSEHEFSYISSEYLKSRKDKVACYNDLLISMSGNRHDGSPETWVGKVAPFLKNEPYLINQRVGALRVKDDKVLNARFAGYQLSSWQYQSLFISIATSSGGQANISPRQILEVAIKFPSLPEQKAIAHVLGTLDDRIELNRKINETLEGIAQTLFKSWFVDFDPVIDNALTSGKEIPEELSEKAQARAALGDKRKPLPEGIRSLFPDEFTYSDELGWIPFGWEVKSIAEALDVNPRIPLKKGDVATFVDMKALPTSGFSVAEVTEKPFSGGAKFNNGDVLLARITPCLENGKTGVVDFLENDEAGFGSTEFIVLRGKGDIKTPFVACLSRYDNFRTHCIQSMVGTSGRQRVQNDCFSYFYLALPQGEEILNFFHKMTEGAFHRFAANREQTRSLINLRDTLLPKLLSGELRIPDAEKMVEEQA